MNCANSIIIVLNCVCLFCFLLFLTLFSKEHTHKLGQLCAGVKPYKSTQIPKHTRTNLKKKK